MQRVRCEVLKSIGNIFDEIHNTLFVVQERLEFNSDELVVAVSKVRKT